MKPVGVLGGMGPEATILLMQKVLASVSGGDDSDHIPLIVHQNPQVPSRIAALIEGRGADPGPILAQMARDLKNAGAQFLAMSCNTAHHYAPQVEAATDLPFLHMIDLTAKELAAGGAKKIGMLASPATRRVGVFDATFAAHGLTPVWTTNDDDMLSLIRAVKAGERTAQMEFSLEEQAAHLLDIDADHLLIACTEISLLTGCLPSQVPWTDSLDCLCTAIVSSAIGA